MIKVIKQTQSIDNRIVRRIYGSGRGSVFTSTDFMDLGSRAAVDKALSRLAASSTLRRLSRGLYDYPKTHPVLGILYPTPETVAKVLTNHGAIRLQPAGAYAANLFGLSEQVPAKIIFLTNGPSRKIKLGTMEINLRRTAPRNVAAAGRLSGLLIQALRFIGRFQITPSRIQQIRRSIPAGQRRKLLRDLRFAPAWMHQAIREIAREKD